ncbi:MAG: L-threonylcarbamoyladenylate synthase [Chloroflexota bacterium]
MSAPLVLEVDPSAPDRAAITRAAEALRAGLLMAFPTETVYGLGADALDPEAVGRIFVAKGRPADNPLIVHLPSLAAAEALVGPLPAVGKALAARFWPGPLSLVVPHQGNLPAAVTGGLSTVALRVPAHPVALALLEAVGVPVAAPSANRSGSPSPTTAQHVLTDLAEHVAGVLDGGPCKLGVESTVLDVTGPTPVLLRPGGLGIEELEAVTGGIVLPGPGAEGESLRARSPGTRYRHYAPRARVVLAAPTDVAALAQRWKGQGQRVGTLSPEPASPLGSGAPHWSAGPGAEGYARVLYAALRALDEAGCTLIVAATLPETGLGRAVMDRLRRAADAGAVEGEGR